MADRPKPCPFCGGDTLHISHRDDGTHAVMCREDKCDVSVCTWSFSIEAEAIAAWNRRTPPSTAGWLPISTAPKSGGVLIVDPTWGVCEGTRFADGSWGLATFNGTIKKANPILWQPLPPAPSQEGASEGEGSPAEDSGPV